MFRISLIIPTYNRAAQLIAALQSVVVQDLPPAEWECVVVNNRSDDDTAERFAAFAAAHPACHLRMVDEQQAGLSHARNRGIAEAQAPLLAFIDDDEWIEPQFLRAYVELFEVRPTAMAAGGPIVAEYPEGRPAWLSKYPETAIANVMYFGRTIRPFPANRIPGGGNMALRREAFDLCGGFDPQLGRVGNKLTGGEENDLFERLREQGYTFWYVPDAVMHHVIPAAKLTESYFRNLCRNIGLNQRQRARIHRRETRTCMAEIAKWGATLLLCCTMHPLQARWLLRMRTEITRGMFTAPKNNTEMRIIEVEERIPFLRDQLLKVWENSVRATHLFLSDAEIKDIKKYVPQALREVTHLLIAEDETGNPIAFMGVDGARLEMLFVAPEERGKGIGKNLLRNGIERYAIRELTVNEQNPQAREFYEHMGFQVCKRTDHDEQGNPYPLLYMTLE